MKKTGKLLLSFMLMLSFILSGMSIITSVEAADEPYTVTYPDSIYGNIILKLSSGNHFEWLKVYATEYESEYSDSTGTSESVCKGEGVLISDLKAEDFDKLDGDDVDNSDDNDMYLYTVNTDNSTSYVKFEFKLIGDSKTYVWEWKRPNLSDYKPVILDSSITNTSSKGYYDIVLTCDSGDFGNYAEVTDLFIYDTDGNLLDTVNLDNEGSLDDVNYIIDDNGHYIITYSSILGGKEYKLVIKNSYGVLSDVVVFDKAKDSEVPDELNNVDTTTASPESIYTLKVSSKNSGNKANISVSTNRKSKIYIDGVCVGTTKNNKLTTQVSENGKYRITAVDKNSNFKEKSIKIKGLKLSKSKAPKVTSREEWNNESENNSRLPQTGTIAISTIVLLAVICTVVGLIIYKKKGVHAK